MRRFRILATLNSTDHEEYAPENLWPAMEAQMQRDEIDDERHRALHYRQTWAFQRERDPLPVRVDLPAMPTAQIERMMGLAGAKRRIA